MAATLEVVAPRDVTQAKPAPGRPAIIHPTAEVAESAEIGSGTRIWHHVHIREGVRLGRDCIIGKGAYIDTGVHLGDQVKIQNGANVYHGTEIEDGVFVGPGAIFTNDRRPRAITPEGKLKSDADWTLGRILVRNGASIGAGAIILPNVTIGRFAMVGAGAVVTRDVPDYGLVLGIPARLSDFVCPCGSPLGVALHRAESEFPLTVRCPQCNRPVTLNHAWAAP